MVTEEEVYEMDVPTVQTGCSKEAVVALHNGFTARFGDLDMDCCTYVCICDPDGEELFYWDVQEWKDEPDSVMGAIMGAMARLSQKGNTS